MAWLRQTLARAGGRGPCRRGAPGRHPPAPPGAAARPPSASAAGARRTASALELAAEDVRLAARALDRITGRIDPEQVLGPDLRDLLHRQVSCFT